MLGAVCLDQSLLEELREFTLVYSGLPGMGLLVVTQDDPPGSLEWGKDAHIQWLELVCRVGRETDESDVVGLARVDDSRRQVTGQIVSYKKFLALQSPQVGQNRLEEVFLELESSKPSRFRACVDGSGWPTLLPRFIDVGSLLETVS
jgi:hypothetical protein